MGISDRTSLPPGRNHTDLTPDEIRRASNVFNGMESEANVRYDQGARTSFRVVRDDHGTEYGEIVFGPDIYPGKSVVDPNSALSLNAAAAHELSHFHRWQDKLELELGHYRNLDEAMTSLQAILRYERRLTDHDVRQLVSYALQRLILLIQELPVASRLPGPIETGQGEKREERVSVDA